MNKRKITYSPMLAFCFVFSLCLNIFFYGYIVEVKQYIQFLNMLCPLNTIAKAFS